MSSTLDDLIDDFETSDRMVVRIDTGEHQAGESLLLVVVSDTSTGTAIVLDVGWTELGVTAVVRGFQPNGEPGPLSSTALGDVVMLTAVT
jgi:1,4-dihydroxy-2-naphthoate octaprenyltransferase